MNTLEDAIDGEAVRDSGRRSPPARLRTTIDDLVQVSASAVSESARD